MALDAGDKFFADYSCFEVSRVCTYRRHEGTEFDIFDKARQKTNYK